MKKADLKSDCVSSTGRSEMKDESKLRLLVAIASFGDKNLQYLREIIEEYRSMRWLVDIVVFSNAPKPLDGVTVKVGLPSKNPWSLPFAHKEFFRTCVNDYDLFIYSEDDIKVTEQNIRAFLAITPYLSENEIAGFLRYEVDTGGGCSLPEVHGTSHWKVDSVRGRGRYTIAEFSNEHSAFYLLTRSQLMSAIRSGGFLREPSSGKYDMLCTAATDPYTNCGFKKVICISSFDDFLIHHMPNHYAGVLGQSLSAFRSQIKALLTPPNDQQARQLWNVESKLPGLRWSKSYYEGPSDEMVTLLQPGTALVVGCGSGDVGLLLTVRGLRITAIPIDSVIGAVAADKGVEIVEATSDDLIEKLRGRRFNSIVINDILHLLSDPFTLLRKCLRCLAPGGALILSGPNFNYLPVLAGRILRQGNYKQLQNFATSGIYPGRVTEFASWLGKAGFNIEQTIWKLPSARKISGSVHARRGIGSIVKLTWRKIRVAGIEYAEGFSGRRNAYRRLPYLLAELVAEKWMIRASDPN